MATRRAGATLRREFLRGPRGRRGLAPVTPAWSAERVSQPDVPTRTRRLWGFGGWSRVGRRGASPPSGFFCVHPTGGGSFEALSRESYSQCPGNVYSRRGVRAPSCTASFLGGVSERPAVCLVAMRCLRGRARGRRVQRRKRSFEKWPFRCFRPLTDTTSAPFGRPADEMAADHASRRQESFAERDSPHPQLSAEWANGAFLLRAFQELSDTPFSRFLISFRISPWPQARLSIELGRADLGV